MSGKVKAFLFLVSAVGFFLISSTIERHQHNILLPVYFLLFILYLFQLYTINRYSLKQVIVIATLLRITVMFTMPNLSDDFYRFIWDGRLLSAGYNPFQQLPAENLGVAVNINQELFLKLNSQNYYSIYPPFAQLIFFLSNSAFTDNIYGGMLVMKIFSFIAEAGLLLMMLRLLKLLKMKWQYIAVYALNPLVIVEVVGNLHHEGIMLFFLISSVYLLMKNQKILSAIMWGLAILTKLFPLMYLPLLIRRMSFIRMVKYILFVGLIIIIGFSPFADGIVKGMSGSLSLYFQKFEFNASIYYIIREVGFWIKGFNIIETAGPYLGATVFILIIIYSFSRSGLGNIFREMTWVFLIYLLLSTTVHPWYIISLIAFSVFSGYLFPLIWSFLIFFTYSGYDINGYNENILIITIEYVVVLSLAICELRKPLLTHIMETITNRKSVKLKTHE